MPETQASNHILEARRRHAHAAPARHPDARRSSRSWSRTTCDGERQDVVAGAGLPRPLPDLGRQREVHAGVRGVRARRAEVLRRGVHRARHDLRGAAQGHAPPRRLRGGGRPASGSRTRSRRRSISASCRIMTPLGTFVINGAERVVVSQLHRSPGVVFEEDTHPNGQRLFSARIIPFRGSWVEFTIDIHDVIYVHIDKKKKFPATALLRAFGYGDNAEILRLFFADQGARHHRQARGPAGAARGASARCSPPTCPIPRTRRATRWARWATSSPPSGCNELRHVGVKHSHRLRRLHHARPRGDEEQPTTIRERAQARAGLRRAPTPRPARCWPKAARS